MRYLGADQRGLALIAVLWTVALVATIAAQVMGRTNQDLRLARNLAERTAAELAADGGIRYAVAQLAAGSDAQFGTDGTLRMAVGDVTVEVAVDNEAARIDLNAAPPALIEALLLSLGLPADQARSSADVIVRFQADPGFFGPSAAAPPRFAVPLELSLVPGLSPAVPRLMMPYVTTFTGQARPTADTHLVPVRKALDMLKATEAPPEPQALSTGAAYASGSVGAAPRLPDRTVRIVAMATGPSGARFTRTAVLAVQPQQRMFHTVFSWQRSWTEE